jgi:hypothetical protein
MGHYTCQYHLNGKLRALNVLPYYLSITKQDTRRRQETSRVQYRLKRILAWTHGPILSLIGFGGGKHAEIRGVSWFDTFPVKEQVTPQLFAAKSMSLFSVLCTELVLGVVDKGTGMTFSLIELY